MEEEAAQGLREDATLSTAAAVAKVVEDVEVVGDDADDDGEEKPATDVGSTAGAESTIAVSELDGAQQSSPQSD